MVHVALGGRLVTSLKIRLSLPLVVVIWFGIQYLLWSVLERHHPGSPASLLLLHHGTDTANSNVRSNPARNQDWKGTTGVGVRQGVTAHQKATRSVNPSPTSNTNTDNNFHIVFSTDCSGYQHWQGILLYYSARRVHQPGVITRIASGCTTEQQASIRNEWRRIDPTGTHFKVHFAPSTALEGSAGEKHPPTYKYSNKPGGILHWLQHQPQELDEATVVCLLDPDMILLKPITADLVASKNWNTRNRGKHQIEYINEQGTAQLLRDKALLEDDETNPVSTHVTTGYPAGQHFGIGGAWVQGMASHAKPAWRNFSKALVCGGEGAPCTTTSASDAAHKYAVGPVYLATVADWKRIAATWWEFVPKVYPQYPFLLAEMYSLTMAVANLELPFQLFSSYMITGSDVSSPTEAWSWIDGHLQHGQQQQQASTEKHSKLSVAQQICSGVYAALLSAIQPRSYYCYRRQPFVSLCQTQDTPRRIFL